MLKITKRLTGPEAVEPQDELTLTWDDRKRGRLRTITNKGFEIGLFLERGKVLQDGELLEADSGEVIRVVSAQEPVTTAYSNDPLTFARICYHLGNRHVPLQVGNSWVRFQPDYVLEDLVKLYGLTVVHEEAPFEPENGAYGEHSHGHSHDHSQHGHRHDHGHPHAHNIVRLRPLSPSIQEHQGHAHD